MLSVKNMEYQKMKIGEKVILNTLLRDGDFPGEITDYDFLKDMCSVKLKYQDKPVSGVLFFNEKPEIVNSNLWQICWPMSDVEKNG
jgi:hypothetical protein